jgi:predicted  nucleic acid-binding Zn-ribbon protein
MPPVGSQGSRSGLVAAVITFTILFVTATIFAIYYGVQASQNDDKLTTLTKRFADIASDADQSSPTMDVVLRQAQNDPALTGGSQTVVSELLLQRDDLRKVLVGPAGNIPGGDPTTMVKDVLTAAATAVADANTKLAGGGQTLDDTSNLVQAIQSLTSEITSLSQNLDTANHARDKAMADETAYKQGVDASSAQLQKTIDDLKNQLAGLDNDKQQLISKAQDQLNTMQASFTDEEKVAAQAAQAAETQRIELTTRIDSLNKLIDQLRQKLHTNRVQTDETVVRRNEGTVAQLSDVDTVYIDLGRGDQIVPGMTFEVYDKGEPLPKLDDGMSEDNMPVGKGSIEVMDVLNGTSKCHINHLEPGQTLAVGDPILNIVYDPNTKYKFFVYGDFDLNRRVEKQNNDSDLASAFGGADNNDTTADEAVSIEAHKPNPEARQLIKGLVVQFGGEVEDHLGVDTDFVVMGAPPEVETFTPEELRDTLKQETLANEKLAAEKYDQVVNEARDLGIPIMNQNRFLYFIGYYDIAPLAAR